MTKHEKPISLFARLSPWIGTVMMFVIMYFHLVENKEINLVIASTAGALMVGRKLVEDGKGLLK